MLEKDKYLTLERPKVACCECGSGLDEFSHHPSSLRMGESESRRLDFCPDCWEFAKSEVRDSYWVTRRAKKEKRARRLSRREKAVAVRALFESFWDQRESEDLDAHLYFLSHLLLRWGGLKFVRTEEDAEGRELLVFENPATGDPIEIRNVDAMEDSILEIKEKIEKFLIEYAPEEESVLD